MSKITNQKELDAAVEKGENNTPLKAIRMKCLDCSCYELKEIRECIIVNCPLYIYRDGKNPNLKRDLTPEKQEEMNNRMAKMRSKRAK